MLDASLLPLRNSRARLRALRATDARAFAEGTADQQVKEYGHLPEPEYTPASVRAMLEEQARPGLERGDLAVLAIADPVSDAFAGSLVIFGADHEGAELGFWMHPSRRRGGLAAAALDLAAEFAARSGLHRLSARTMTANVPSQRVLGRAGFVLTGQETQTAPSGREVDLLHYSRELLPPLRLPLTTPRLRLRLHAPADARALQAIYARDEVARFLLEEPWSRDDAVRRVRERCDRTGLDRACGALALVIERESAVIGDVALWWTDRDHGTAEIGWVLDPGHGGRGLATEAVRAVLDLAFAHDGLHRVVARMDARNTASARLAERCGMRHEAHLRKDWWSKGEWTDTTIFAMLAEDR